MIARSTSPPLGDLRGILSVPPEVLELVYLQLDIPDRLRLLRTCKQLRGIYRDSALLAYDFSLSTLAYLDVPRGLPSEDDKAESEDSDDDAPEVQPDQRHSGPSLTPFARFLDSYEDIHIGHEDYLGAPSTPPDPDPESALALLASVGTENISPERLDQLRRKLPQALLDQLSHHHPPFLDSLSGPGRSDPHSIASRNARLEERERRWEELDPKHTAHRVVSGPAGVYELQEGIFLLCDDYMGPAGPGTGKPMSIRLFKLPDSDTSPDPRRRDDHGGPAYGRLAEMPFERHALEFAIADLTMDPTQDLIVVSEHRPSSQRGDFTPPSHRLHLLSMSTFKPHPLASTPTLDFPPFAQAVGSTKQLLQIMDDTIIVLVSRYAALWLGNAIPHLPGMESEEEIVVWNWKTGNVISRMALPENGWFSSLALLTPTSFMITSTSSISPVLSMDNMESRSVASVFPPVIQIYSFLPDPSQPAVPLQPLSAEHEDDSTARPVLLAQLELPRFAEYVVVSSFDVRPDPAFPPRSTTDPTRSYPACGTKSFAQDPSKGLLVFDLDVIAPPSGPVAPRQWPHHAYELFVLRETLVDYAHQGEQRLRDRRAEFNSRGWGNHRVEEIVPWSSWGLDGARLMDISMKRRAWVCSCSGYRFASLARNMFSTRISDDHDDDDDRFGTQEARMPHISDVRILDFSPFSVRKEVARRRAILQDPEYPYVLPRRTELASAIATAGYYDDPAHGIRITEKPWTVGPKYEIWRNIHDTVWKRAVTESTILPRLRVFQENIETRLPYVETVRMEGMWANGVMMDDQRIMIISTHESGGLPPLTVQKMTILCM